jgi:hypothetical protein
MKKIKNFLSKTIMPFFVKNGTIKPIRFFITILLSLIVKALWMKIEGNTYLSDNFVLGLLAATGGLMTVDTWRSNSKDKNNVEKD